MKQAYIKPTVVVVAMEKLMLDTLSKDDGKNGAPDRTDLPNVPEIGERTPADSKGHDSWGIWDDYPSQGSLWD